MSAPDNPQPWIGGQRFDLLFFFGSGVLAFAVGIAVVLMPALLVPFVWLWLWLVDGPHLVATWQRIGLDARERQVHWRLLMSSFVAILVAVALWALSAVAARPEPFDFLLVAATFLSGHHLLRQHYGIMAIYEAQTRIPAPLWQLDQRLLQSALWIALAISLVATPANRDLFAIPSPLPWWGRVLGIGGVALMSAIVATLIASMVWRRRKGLSLRPAWFALLPVLGVSCFALFGVGAFEPLLPHPTNKEQIFLAATLVGGLVHGLQYIGIV